MWMISYRIFVFAHHDIDEYINNDVMINLNKFILWNISLYNVYMILCVHDVIIQLFKFYWPLGLYKCKKEII